MNLKAVFAGTNEITGEVVNGWVIQTRENACLSIDNEIPSENRKTMAFPSKDATEMALAALKSHGITSYEDTAKLPRRQIVEICKPFMFAD